MALGYIRRESDMKFLILFILDVIGEAVAEESLLEAVLTDECADYFTFSEALAELMSDGFVAESDKGYGITALGKTTVLGWDPYEADVTDAVRAGAPIDVTVVGTRRNVFGPLHEIPRLNGAYGPGNFVTGGKHWTDDYSLLDSGLRGITLKVQK